MTVHLIVHGYVQGVGFRQFVKYSAKKLNITGWVQNLPNRTVEIMASGDQENLRKLIAQCEKGPFLAKVERVKTREVNSEQFFQSFDIIRP